VKYKDHPLKIIDVLTKEVKTVQNFQTPEAFIFIYEKEIFLSLKQGKIILYSITGDIISNFETKTMYS
jgi:hypothetical protein